MKDETKIPGGDSCMAVQSEAEFNCYIETLSPGQACIAYAKSTCFDMVVAFGATPNDLKILGTHTLAIAMTIHEGFMRGEWRPIPGTVTDYSLAQIREICGGMPRPEQREMVIREIMIRAAAVLKDSCERRMLGSVPKPFIPLGQIDPKRDAAMALLDDPSEAGGEPK